ncbi:hypothetical protein C1930_17880 [Stenotrophomonas sp. SAU14A_NAIMI4_8]|nr:hypothetical protein C1931_17955 [Stenotrophomonas sp. YAU14A_MKIMI4_1]AWH34614.1 hypothetical protein C1930_17880 [Stenotrophomonas sp. SAU14A_NAIMI4_8]
MDGGQRLRGCGRDQGRSELETDPSAPAMRLALRKCDSARYIAGVVISLFCRVEQARLYPAGRAPVDPRHAWMKSRPRS